MTSVTKQSRIILVLILIGCLFGLFLIINKPNTTNYFGTELTILHEEVYRYGFDSDTTKVQVLDVPAEKFKYIKDYYLRYDWEESPIYSTSTHESLDFALAFSNEDPFIQNLISEGVEDAEGFEVVVIEKTGSSNDTSAAPPLIGVEIYSVELWVYNKKTGYLYYIFVQT